MWTCEGALTVGMCRSPNCAPAVPYLVLTVGVGRWEATSAGLVHGELGTHSRRHVHAVHLHIRQGSLLVHRHLHT